MIWIISALQSWKSHIKQRARRRWAESGRRAALEHLPPSHRE